MLNDRRRVIAKKAMASALGLKSEGGNAFMRTMSRSGIRSAASEKLIEKLENPIFFKPLRGDLADGYDAEVLIEVCDAFIQARNDDKLAPSQSFLARQAEIVLRSAAKIGIVALIDEATGYKDKVKDEYKQLFDQFIRDEFRQWVPKIAEFQTETLPAYESSRQRPTNMAANIYGAQPRHEQPAQPQLRRVLHLQRERAM